VASPEPRQDEDEAGHGAEARCATACGTALACGPGASGRVSEQQVVEGDPGLS